MQIMADTTPEKCLCISNPTVSPAQRHQATRIIYSIILASSVSFLTSYSILWSKIQPPLDLYEAGNAWTFIAFLTTCAVGAVLTGIALVFQQCKGPLHCKYLAVVDLTLMLGWASLILVGIGAAEEYQHRGNGQSIRKSTSFGLYIAGACGTNITQWSVKNGFKPIGSEDVEKCNATKRLQVEILCMYVWVVELYVLLLLHVILAIGNCNKGNNRQSCCVNRSVNSGE